MPGLGLNEMILPLLLEKAKEGRAQKARDERLTSGTAALKTLYSDKATKEEKLEAYAQAQTLGFNPSSKTLGPEVDETLVDELAQSGNWSESFTKLVKSGAVPLDIQTVQYGAKTGQEVVDPDAYLATLEKAGLLPEGMTADKLKAIRAYAKDFGVDAAQAMLRKTGLSDKDDGRGALVSVFDKRDAGKTDRSDYTAEEWAALDKIFPSDERKNQFFNREFDLATAYKMGASEIERQTRALWFGGLGVETSLAQWLEGTLKDKAKASFFAKFYDRGTGGIDYQKVANLGVDIIAKANETIKAANKTAELPDDAVGLAQAFVANGDTEDTIDWDKLAKDLENYGYTVKDVKAALRIYLKNVSK